VEYKSIIKVTGALEVVLGLLMLLVPLIDMMTGKPITTPFLYTALILIFVGYLLQKVKGRPLTLFQGVIVTCIAS
jgi:trk system potassium uptake protein TrkH